jgi:glycosyltransferase involved in cell wall biosynthesis/nucleoside phosphorylase
VQPAKTSKVRVPLVIVAALKQELPCPELAAWGYAPFSIAQLKAEGPQIIRNKKALLILSGVGIENARRAAEWIIAHLDTDHVVNIGTAGAKERTTELFSWIEPESIVNDTGEALTHTGAFYPLPWPLSGEHPQKKGTLMTVTRPEHEALPDFCDYCDMEAFEYARMLAAHDIAFHAVKIISDHVGRDNSASFSERLAEVRRRTVTLLAFLGKKGPDKSDVSVIIPVFNRTEPAARAIESVLAQTHAPCEIIVVDDGSDDGSRELFSKFKGRIHPITLARNHGVSYARNRAIEQAQGSWIAFLDSDDTWHPAKLEKQLQHLREHPYYRLSQCEEIWIRDQKRVNRCRHHNKRSGWMFAPSLQLCLVSPSAVIMERELLLENGLFDEALPACEDYDLWLKILRFHPAGLSLDPSLVKYGGHEDQLSRKYAAMDRFRVTSLIAAYEREALDFWRRALAQVIISKAAILAGGFKKRSNEELADFYQNIVHEYRERHPVPSCEEVKYHDHKYD